MILVDANVFLNAYNQSADRHGEAKEWLERAMAGDEPIGLSWVVALAFIRIATSKRVFLVPMTGEEAIETVGTWMERDIVEVLHPGERHLAFLGEQMKAGNADGPLTMDAHLAALAQEYGASICSFDSDFKKFPGVRLVVP